MQFFKAWYRKKAGIKNTLNTHTFLQKDADGKDVFQYDYMDADNNLVSVVLKHIYTDKAQNKYYQFVNPIQMTMERNIASSTANKEFGYNMTVEELTKLCDAALTSNASRDTNGVAITLHEIKTRASKLVEYETTLKLGGIYFLMNDEHPGLYNPLTTNKKLEIWRADDEARGFFLQLVWDTVRPYTQLSSADLLTYLTAEQDPTRKARKMTASDELKQKKQETGAANSKQKASGSFNTIKL